MASVGERSSAATVPVPESVSRAVIVETPARKPSYKPMVADRPTRTPHSGYHFDGTGRRFFEAWYFQVALPEMNQSFAWMYTSENPGAETEEGSNSQSSGAAQVMGADEEYLYQDAMTLKNFWGG